MRASLWTLLAALSVAATPAARGEEPLERVVLRWQPVQGAVGYDLQVAADPSFARRELEVRVELSGYRLGAADARRFWRVRAVDADGRPGQWSAAKTIAPRAQSSAPAPVAAAATEPEPGLRLLQVPPLPPAAIEEAAPREAEAGPSLALDAARVAEGGRAADLRDDGALEGIRLSTWLREGRPGALVGWRANLLGVTAPSVELEVAWPLPWLGAPWSAALRGGWWREEATVRATGGWLTPFEATADVVPLRALLLRARATRWARLYAGAGLGADLVAVRVPGAGALEASAAAEAVGGAGRRVGPGEAFAELAGSLGGVDGPLGRMRTGGFSLSVGYRLSR